MLEWRDFLFAEGGAGGDREMEGDVQHAASTLGAGLQAAGAGGLWPRDAAQSDFTAHGCDVDSLIETGTKTRAGQCPSSAADPRTTANHP